MKKEIIGILVVGVLVFSGLGIAALTNNESMDNHLPIITGPTFERPGTYEYTFKAIDQDGDNVSYEIRLGDDVVEKWIGWYASGEEITRSHTYPEIHKPKPADTVDMLIFVSPQYADDEEILQAINNYIGVVEEDVNWSTEVIDISSELNDFKKIDNIMESYYENYNIKACIMVGEDTDTVLGGDTDYKEGASTVPWYTTGGEEAYEIVEGGIVQGPNKMDICISLIYPTSDLDYTTKKSQIISVFNKFSVHRHIYYIGDILVFVDSKMAQANNNKTRHIYQSIDDYGCLYYKEDPTKSELQSSLEESYSMYYVGGHSSPSGTCVNANGSAGIRACYLDQLDTPFFGASGCYVNGWWSDFPDNNRLDPSITKQGGSPHYGSMIFTAPRLRVMVLGFLSISGWSYPVSFIEHAIPDLTDGKTLADSMIGHIYDGDDQTVVGDPTFHYSFDNEQPDAPIIDGPIQGKVGKEYEYTFNAEDPDEDGIKYFINWGDGNTTLTEFEFSGIDVTVKHSWDKEGVYNITAKTIDFYGNESDWSTLEVTMPKNKPFNFQFNRLAFLFGQSNCQNSQKSAGSQPFLGRKAFS